LLLPHLPGAREGVGRLVVRRNNSLGVRAIVIFSRQRRLWHCLEPSSGWGGFRTASKLV
jgi:hypothetical protein